MISPDGSVERLRGLPLPFPRDAACCAARDVWSAIRQHHLVVGRAKRILWRSRVRLSSRWQVGVVMVGRHHVVFQAHHKLYLAPVNGIERPVAHREEPLGWTENGLYTYSYLRRELLFRSLTGRLIAVIARAPFHAEYPVSDGTLFFFSEGRLVKAHGTRVGPQRSLRSLGFTSDTFIEPVGPLLELLNDHQLVLLRSNGSVYGRISSPGRISGALSVAPRASSVAFTLASGRSETVDLLRPNGRPPVQLYHQAIASPPPYQLTDLQWHGGWLLYSDSNQHTLAAVNIRQPRESIEMTGLLGGVLPRLAGPLPAFDAYWAEQAHH